MGDLGILCVLAGAESLSLEELLRKTVLAGTADNKIVKKIEDQKIDHIFWRFCEKLYGYNDTAPTIQNFLVTMLVTYVDA